MPGRHTDSGICHLGFVGTSEGDAVDNLVTEWKEARMVEDYQSHGSPFIEPIFDLRFAAHGSETSACPPARHELPVESLGGAAERPTGVVTTYEGIASMIGKPSAIRAVGTAVGHNPIAVLIPCHRVIRKVGDFGNYRYGALRKKALLACLPKVAMTKHGDE
jgi:AraC family transcriptional regulator, regulatory protein of adaptative response / methylated-DNA-[protein]-cysteine methyltransferase